MPRQIHPTAIIEPGAELGHDVRIDAYAVIGAHVSIGDDTSVGSHAVIQGRTRIGKHNRIFAHVALGGEPQDKKYAGEDTLLEIGHHNTIREFCTFNLGTEQGGGVTRLGDHNWIMAYVHLAHDCQVGHHTIFANNAALAGHVQVGDHAILGGYTNVHQFCLIGAHAITGIATVVLQDVPAYVIANGNPAQPYGLNAEGLRRRGLSAASLQALERAYRLVYRSDLPLEQAMVQVQALHDAAPQDPDTQTHLRTLLTSLQAATRGIIRNKERSRR